MKNIYRVIINANIEYETDSFDELLEHEILPNIKGYYETDSIEDLLFYYCNNYGAEIKIINKEDE